MLLDQHRHHSDRWLLRFFLQGHLNDNANVDLDVILKVMLERVDAVNLFPLIKKREARRLDGIMYFVLLLKRLSWFEVLSRRFGR